MFGPSDDEVNSEEECRIWHDTKMMELLVRKPMQARYS